MINPQSLDLASLPSVPLAEKGNLPASPGIYFAIDSFNTIQYIGLSTNAKRRWSRHHRYEQLSRLGGIKLAWLIVDNIALLSEIEKALIAHFKPAMNISHISHKKSNPDYSQVAGLIHKSVFLKFKSKCAMQEIQMAEMLEELIKRWLEES